MLLTLKQIARKIRKCEATTRVYIDRYCLKQIKLKNTGQLVYDVPVGTLNEMVEFSLSGRRNGKKKRNRKND